MNKIKMFLRTYGTVSLNHNTWAEETEDPVFTASIIYIMDQYEIHETISNLKISLCLEITGCLNIKRNKKVD